MKKLVNYLPFAALFILPLLFYPAVNTSGWKSSSDVHALLEFAASLLAVTAGIMVLLHFFTTSRWFFLIISIGFVLIGTEEFVHAIFSFNRMWPETLPTFKLAISSTWLTGNFILAASFFIALIFREREIVPAKRVFYAVVYNIIGLFCAVLVTLLIFNSPLLPDFVRLGSITKKLIELSLGLLFFIAFLFYSTIYLKQQSHSPLLWSIIAFIIFRVLVHIFVFDSQAFYDSQWDAAHLIVFLSYFFPIFGVWGETIKLQKSAQSHVIELEKEMTERKRVEYELFESEKHYRMLFNAIDEGFCIIEVIFDKNEKPVDYRFLEINPSFEKQTGLINAQGKRMRELAPKHEEYWFDIYGKIALTGQPARFVNRAEELHRWYDVYAFRLGQPENRQVAILFNDITERKRLEDNLKNEQQELKLIIDSSPIIVFYKDKEGKFIRVNKTFAEAIKLPEEEFVGKTVFDLYSAKIAQDMTNDDQEVLKSGHPKINIIEQYESASGIRWVQTDKIPICDKNGIPFGLIGFSQDITERKRAEKKIKSQLEELQRWQDAMLGREDRVQELKREVNELCRQLGEKIRYSSQEEP